MTSQETSKVLEQVEKKPFKSKKFLAWFLGQIFMCTMAIIALIEQPELGWPLASYMVGIVFMMGISTMWYLGKQAAADIAVRGFAIVGQIPNQFKKPFEGTDVGKADG